MKKIFRIIIIPIFVLLAAHSTYSKDKSVKIYFEKKPEGKYELYCENKNFIPYYAVISFPEVRNIKIPVKLPYSVVIKPKTKKKLLFKFKAKDLSKSFGFKYHYVYCKGDPDKAKHDDSFQYIFPFEHGKKFKVSQGYHGKLTHKDNIAYSLDFEMKIGTLIIAAREGTVVEKKEDSNIGGNSSYYDDHANKIIIMHDDGSFATYAHLKKNGAAVKAGDKIKQGQVIGYSGNTGRSSGPHLHFTVNIPTEKARLVSIPTKFLNHEEELIKVIAGKYYYSYHPGKEKFKAEFGENLKNKDFNDHNVKIKYDNSISTRTEEVDDTIILFIKNGKKKNYEIIIECSFINLTSSKKLPFKIIVPPLTEKFLFILKPKDPLEEFRYRMNFKWREKR